MSDRSKGVKVSNVTFRLSGGRDCTENSSSVKMSIKITFVQETRNKINKRDVVNYDNERETL